MGDLFRFAWARFTRIAASYGDLQGRAIATLFYFTVLMPFGLAVTLFSDPLHIKGEQPKTWLAREPVDATPDGAMRQG